MIENDEIEENESLPQLPKLNQDKRRDSSLDHNRMRSGLSNKKTISKRLPSVGVDRSLNYQVGALPWRLRPLFIEKPTQYYVRDATDIVLSWERK